MNIIHLYFIVALTVMVSANSMEQTPGLTPKSGKNLFRLIKPQGAYPSAPPLIGIYGPDYPMLDRLALIQLDPAMLGNYIPGNLRIALSARIPHLIYNVLISKAEPKTYNLVFHEWARNWAAHKSDQGFYNIDAPMGIFAPNGIQTAQSLAFDKLSNQNINVHPGAQGAIAYSPNNARFTVSPNREISTFWSAALSPDRQHGIITFHIFANSARAQNAVKDALQKTNYLEEFIQELARNAHALPPVDTEALEQALQTIGAILGVQKKENEPPVQAAHNLQHQLQELTNTFKQLNRHLR